jgi:hypothetical protein
MTTMAKVIRHPSAKWIPDIPDGMRVFPSGARVVLTCPCDGCPFEAHTTTTDEAFARLERHLGGNHPQADLVNRDFNGGAA